MRRRGDDAGDKGKAAAAPAKAAAAAPAPKVSAKANLACYLLYIDDDGADLVRVERDGEPLLIRPPRARGHQGPQRQRLRQALHGRLAGRRGRRARPRQLQRHLHQRRARAPRRRLNDGDVLRCVASCAPRSSSTRTSPRPSTKSGDDWEDDELDPETSPTSTSSTRTTAVS
ncbi:MAG: hypothetical protein U1F43_15025 [Myxococcota bacterium]